MQANLLATEKREMLARKGGRDKDFPGTERTCPFTVHHVGDHTQGSLGSLRHVLRPTIVWSQGSGGWHKRYVGHFTCGLPTQTLRLRDCDYCPPEKIRKICLAKHHRRSDHFHLSDAQRERALTEGAALLAIRCEEGQHEAEANKTRCCAARHASASHRLPEPGRYQRRQWNAQGLLRTWGDEICLPLRTST